MKITIRNNIYQEKHIYQGLYNIYIYSISDLFAFLPCLVKKLSDNIQYDKEYISQRTVIPKILLLSFFDFAAQFSNFLFNLLKGRNKKDIAKSNLNILLIFKITSNYLLSRFLLKTYFFRHHYVSFGINIFFLIILGIFDALEIIKINEESGITLGLIIYILIKIFNTLCYSVENVYGKKILMENFITPYNLLLIRGSLNLILLLFFSIPFIFIEVNDNDEKSIIFIQFWKFINSEILVKSIILMIVNFFYNINIWIIVDYFSPNHLSMGNIFEYFSYSIYSLIDIYFLGNEKNSQKNIFLFLAFYSFLLIGAFIHNEFIILNFCKLNEKTKLFLDQEASKDLLSTKYDINRPIMKDNRNDSNDDNSALLEMEKSEKIKHSIENEM
jgi:hypothetical protein